MPSLLYAHGARALLALLLSTDLASIDADDFRGVLRGLRGEKRSAASLLSCDRIEVVFGTFCHWENGTGRRRS
ncbi:MAG: hypothetical protein KDB58_07945 [Solirubrobacterales bacterium]|nr:hypothetical protein [Solirubrobacterales bacterium]